MIISQWRMKNLLKELKQRNMFTDNSSLERIRKKKKEEKKGGYPVLYHKQSSIDFKCRTVVQENFHYSIKIPLLKQKINK